MAIEKLIKENPEFIAKILRPLNIKEEQMSKMIEIYNKVSKNPEEYKNISLQKVSHWDWNIKVDLKENMSDVGIKIYLAQKDFQNIKKLIPFGREEGYLIYFNIGEDPQKYHNISLSLHNPITL